MANNGEIIIKIVSEVGQTTQNQPDEKPEAKVDAEKSKTDNRLETAIYTSLLQKTAREVKGITIGEAKYQINRYFRMSDNYLAEQSLDISLNIVNRAISAGASIAAGFAVGGVPGAIIEAGIQAVKIGLDIYHNKDQENIRLNQMDAVLSFNRQRAGYSLTAGSQGENR